MDEKITNYNDADVSDDPYCKFAKDELILRDHLAIDRTILANERTLLAYIRTALAVFVTGVSFIQFFESILMVILGWVFVPIGVITLVIGFWRYKKVSNRFKR
jgi:putative membrane protein